MNPLLFLLLFFALGTLYFILGWRASQKVTSDADYFVAGRKLGIAQITCNLIATQLGGGMLLGTAAAAYTAGYYGILYSIGMSIGFLLLSCGIASRLQRFNVITTAQLFETQYKSIQLKQLASLLSITTLFGILVAQVVGFKSLLIGLGFTSPALVFILWLSVVGYTMLGGLRAITINDQVQLAIITVVFGGIALYTLLHEPAAFFTSLLSQQQFFTATPADWTTLFSLIAMPALFALIEQDLAQRFFASRSSAVATASAFNASIFLTFFAFIPVYFGMKTRLLDLPLPEGANPLIIFLQHSVSDLVLTFALCAIVAAIISTADALLNGISANISQDFNIAARLGITNRLHVSKGITLGIGILALASGYVVPQNIINIIIDSYALSVCCLLVPLLICYFKRDVKKNAAYGALIAGFTGFCIFSFIATPLPREVLALFLSGIGYCIGDKIHIS
jgi:SSS family solute:Na+ symporter